MCANNINKNKFRKNNCLCESTDTLSNHCIVDVLYHTYMQSNRKTSSSTYLVRCRDKDQLRYHGARDAIYTITTYHTNPPTTLIHV